MREEIISVNDIPKDVDFNSTLEINTTKVSYFTHGFFKYPCKFIPNIPRWAILKYSKPKQLVLDPFAGSGTTLVEAVLNQRDALGVDFDKLSQLLCKTKTTLLTKDKIKIIQKNKTNLFKNPSQKTLFRPDLHNINHWFPKKNIRDLSLLRYNIEKLYQLNKDEEIYNFLYVCFASIIKKCSYSDDTSPKPYVSKRIIKEPQGVRNLFFKTVDSYTKNISDYWGAKVGTTEIISEDARHIKAPGYEKRVSVAVTSPPYINAFDYVRSLRLENAWLGYYGDTNIIDIKKRQVGTETIASNIYSIEPKETGINRLDLLVKDIFKKDKKRAFVVMKFFEDMDKNFIEVKKLLKNGGHYVVVVGDSTIRGIEVLTHEFLIDIAKQRGYKLENLFSYVIKNRYLRIPRAGRGGLIKKDWVIDLVKDG